MPHACPVLHYTAIWMLFSRAQLQRNFRSSLVIERRFRPCAWQMQRDQRLIRCVLTAQEQDMAITGRHAGDVISNTVAEVNALVCQLLGLGGHHDTVAAALIGKMLHLADPVRQQPAWPD